MTIPTSTYPPYDAGTPQGTDIPADSQEEFINNFFTINQQFQVDHVPPGNIVKTTESDGVDTILEVTGHYLENGDNITLTNFKAINALGNLVSWSINGNSYNITLIDEDSFSIPVDTTAEPAYLENSGSYLVNEPDFYGFHKKLTFASPTIPFTPAQISGNKTLLFTQKVTDTTTLGKEKDTISLFFQNINEIMRLTGNNYNRKYEKIPFPPPDGTEGHTSVSQYSIDSPFGIKINFGNGSVFQGARNEQVTIPLKLQYTTTHLATFASIARARIGEGHGGSINVPAATLTSFDIDTHNVRTGQNFYFISFGI